VRGCRPEAKIPAVWPLAGHLTSRPCPT
jgi:hypothetical protein